MTHITFQILIDYLEDQLSAATAAEITNHLAYCTQCQSELNLAREFLTNIRGSDLQTPHAALLRRAVGAFRQQHKRQAQRSQQTGNLH